MSDVAARGRSVQSIANAVHGTVHGDPDVQVFALNRIEYAKSGDLSFLSTASYAKFLGVTKASCVLVSATLDLAVPEGLTVVVVDDAYRAFVALMREFYPPLRIESGLRHATASVHPSATIHPSAAISAGCSIGEGCVVGENVQLYPNVVLYPGCTVGAGTVIHANVSCLHGTVIGTNCLIHAGAVLGADGFGYIENADGSFDKVPQVGVVQIGNDVEIGANVTIDRAAVGATSIGDRVKIDNLVHIAHNVTVGNDTAIAAQAGVSGSTRIGNRNRIAGQVGIVGHITTADDVIVEAQSGVSKTITSKGAYFGSPAKEHRTALRMEAALRQLPQLLTDVREMQQRIADLLANSEPNDESLTQP